MNVEDYLKSVLTSALTSHTILYGVYKLYGMDLLLRERLELPPEQEAFYEDELNILLGPGWDKHDLKSSESDEYLSKVSSMWPKFQPGTKDKPVPLSSPKSKLKSRWEHWIKAKRLEPAVLYLACWKYCKTCLDGPHYIKALMNFLSPSAHLVDDYLQWAKEEFNRQKQG